MFLNSGNLETNSSDSGINPWSATSVGISDPTTELLAADVSLDSASRVSRVL
jgi:hypothetical protein